MKISVIGAYSFIKIVKKSHFFTKSSSAYRVGKYAEVFVGPPSLRALEAILVEYGSSAPFFIDSRFRYN